MKKRLMSFIMVAAMALSLVGCGGAKEVEKIEINHTVSEKGGEAEVNEQANATEESEQATTEEKKLLEGKYAVLIEVENYGDILVELDADAAPISVTNFMKLVNNDFYTGLTFHRIIEGFMMQGGQSFEKRALNIKGEFAMNGIENPISHTRGTISMARANDPDSASSQFFICHQDSTFLDGQYAAFGHVITGMDVVDRICEEAIVTDNNGSVAPENQPVIKKITDCTEDYKAGKLGE